MRYVASLLVLTSVSFGMMHVLFGLLIEQVPAISADGGLSRVEKWTLLNSSQAPKTVAAVRGWSEEAETRQPIPAEAILETQGAMVTAGESSDGDAVAAAVVRDSVSDAPKTGTFRTVCVRLCDGAYFPVSFAATPDRFARDEAACQRGCSAKSRLFVYRNPGESPRSMVDLDGGRYTDLSAAFEFKQGYDASCTCRANPWEQEARERHQRYAARAMLSEHHAFAVTASLTVATPLSGARRTTIAVDRAEEVAAIAEEWDEPYTDELAPGHFYGEASAAPPQKPAGMQNPLTAAKPPKLKSAARAQVRRDNLKSLRMMASIESPGELVRHSLLAGF